MPTALDLLTAYQVQTLRARGAGLAGITVAAENLPAIEALRDLVDKELDPRKEVVSHG